MHPLTNDDPELCQTLRAIAKDRGRITYAELAAALSQPGPQRIRRLAERLEASVRADHAVGRPLLASVVVSRSSALPQRGFFDLLQELGRYEGPTTGPQAEAAHAAELTAVYDWWDQNRDDA
ncbi:hypothetical protein [Aquibaculum arenosum]|uniref:AsnC family transcriptional regulator n=1 Tax=Aquibaculum arenosum TaxID=3032591 RepID=A0ABT5YPK0_9PROT|nr:hypothetical protein [Fodinicurvata sp. CAU 1616]MDF2096878.1 hypothetical protein [Fodinicurvata sp. CAU 1616]